MEVEARIEGRTIWVRAMNVIMTPASVSLLAPPEFLEDEKRGLLRYEALRLRVWDEVRDRRQPNPLSSLIRLTEKDST